MAYPKSGPADAALLATLRERIANTLRPLLSGVRRVALLDAPAYANLGDSLILLGTLAVLRALGAPAPCWIASSAAYHRAPLARALGAGTILLSGGGNFGDLWPEHQEHRERILRDFPENAVIQLPQSIHFDDPAREVCALEAVRSHPRFTLLVRDRKSLAFHAGARLCPDLALAFDPARNAGDPGQGVLWIRRSDHERASGLSFTPPPGVAVRNWEEDPATPLTLWAGWAGRNLGRRPRLMGFLRRPYSRALVALARRRCARGTADILGSAAVVTERLHGHVLCLLLGVPHFILDTRQGKISAFRDAWTAACSLGRACAAPQEALALAREQARAG
ncbi:MAG: polysaccharide pyruvyl transferase family protein [Planctomycetaceae bacterium]